MANLSSALKSSLFAVFVAAALAAGCASTPAVTQDTKVVLEGGNEVPPNASAAKGSGTILVAADKSVSGSVTVSGFESTAAHIHEAPAGKAGPVIVPMTKTEANTWTVVAGAKFTDAQHASYLAGNLYVNVHSAAYPGGEIRGQLNSKASGAY